MILSFGNFARDEYFSYWPLYQSLDENPFVTARNEVDHLNNDPDAARRRILVALIHWWINGHDKEAAANTITSVLTSENKLRNDIIFELETEQFLNILPESIWQIVPIEGTRSVDLRISSSLSYDSTVSLGKILPLAAQRGIDCVVLADHGHIAGAQEAARLAKKLKARGKLPADFQVISGEHITCASGTTFTAVGINDRIPEGMTINRTIKEIHDQGGLAFLNHPGEPGGSALTRRLDIDGYFIQPRLFELFRTMHLLYEPRLADKPSLYASHTRYAQLVGLPYSAVITDDCSQYGIVAALRDGQVYPASNLYFPLMTILLLKPIATYETVLNHYFVVHDWVTDHARKLLGADNVILTTTWDQSIKELMSLDAATFDEIQRIADGQSDLLDTPKVNLIVAQYGRVHIEYHRDTDTVWMKSVFAF